MTYLKTLEFLTTHESWYKHTFIIGINFIQLQKLGVDYL